MPIPNLPVQKPGGDFYEVYNMITKDALMKRKQQLENQYYGPNMESQISNRNALTQGQNIENKFAPDRLGLNNELSREKLKQLQVTNPLAYQKLQQDVERSRILNENLPASEKARIEGMQATANWRNSGGSSAGVDQKAAQGFNRQLQMDHPNWTPEQINDASNAYYQGKETFSNGDELPPLTGQAQDRLTKIIRKNAPVAVQNQAANMDILASDLNDIDISPLKKFAGPIGKVEFAKEAFNMATNQPVSNDFRQYLAFKNVTSQFAMDALRKGFGTSVVPGYVYATLGKASNPNSTWWEDPKQIMLEWNKTKEWINNNAARYKAKSKYGVNADISKVKGNSNNGSKNNDPLGIR